VNQFAIDLGTRSNFNQLVVHVADDFGGWTELGFVANEHVTLDGPAQRQVRNSNMALNTAFSTDTEKSVPIPAGRHATVHDTIYMSTAREAQVPLHTSPLPNQGLYGYRPTPFPTKHQFISSWRDPDDDALRCETPTSAKYYAALQ
jgi:hypothetical protein